MSDLFCFGLGYSASRIARRLAAEGWKVTGTARTPPGAAAIAVEGYDAMVFDGLAPSAAMSEALARATHVLVSVPPGDDDPVLRHHGIDLRSAPSLRWIGYLSTVGVYGDRDGGWVDETGPTDATSLRGRQRIAAEAAWLALGASRQVPTHVFRLSGNLRPRPQRHRSVARWHGAPHRQAGSGLQPHPRRRHRPSRLRRHGRPRPKRDLQSDRR
ncbi:MAG: hypothetical protein WDN31_13960 [Hyphomicrobium sp.]